MDEAFERWARSVQLANRGRVSPARVEAGRSEQTSATQGRGRLPRGSRKQSV